MKTPGARRLVAAICVACLDLSAHAADEAATWTLKTDDTQMVLAVRENKIFIETLKNPAQGWNWTPKPSEVPLVRRVKTGTKKRAVAWTFEDAAAANGPRTGAQLMDEGLNVTMGPNASEVIWTNADPAAR